MKSTMHNTLEFVRINRESLLELVSSLVEEYMEIAQNMVNRRQSRDVFVNSYVEVTPRVSIEPLHPLDANYKELEHDVEPNDYYPSLNNVQIALAIAHLQTVAMLAVDTHDKPWFDKITHQIEGLLVALARTPNIVDLGRASLTVLHHVVVDADYPEFEEMYGHNDVIDDDDGCDEYGIDD